jgi:hypothetical protein
VNGKLLRFGFDRSLDLNKRNVSDLMDVRVDQSLVMVDIHVNFRVDVRGMVRSCCLKSDLNLVSD